MNDKPVTKSEFWKRIAPMDVYPRVDESTLKGRYFTSYWETPGRQRIGRSVSDSWGIEPQQYFLVK